MYQLDLVLTTCQLVALTVSAGADIVPDVLTASEE
jgi:hypothetical protein